MNLPRITVVTPSFNQGRFLEQTIRSVLDQGYPNLEYIICDGGSTDNSVEIIGKYQDRLAWWCSGKDNGQSDAINMGLRRGSGDLFTFINSDDTLCPGSLMAAANAFMEGRRWIMGWAMFLEPGGGDWPQLPEAYSRRVDWHLGNPICQQGTFWDASFTRELGYFREELRYAFDYDFWMRLVFRGKTFPHLLRRCMATYRLHEGSKTFSEFDKFEAEFKVIRGEYSNLLTAKEQSMVIRERRARNIEQHRRLGWNAMKQGDVPSARQHARQALGRSPLQTESWRLMYCALRGH